MAKWRRLALEICPAARQDLHDRNYSLTLFLADHLNEMFRGRVMERDREGVLSIYRFVDWALGRAELRNAASISFYERCFQGLAEDEVAWAIKLVQRRVVDEHWYLKAVDDLHGPDG